jgi:autotransporter-associated beta strand protein
LIMVHPKAGLGVVVSCALIVSSFTAAYGQTTIYSDDFSGLSTSPLNGTTPDVTADDATWVAGNGLRANGSTTAVYTAALPFQPQPNRIYNLSAILNSLSTTANDNNWTGLGFLQVLPSNLAANFNNAQTQPALWAMSRSNMAQTTQFDQSFLGYAGSPPGATANGVNSAGRSVDPVTLYLDTRNHDWEWRVDFNSDGSFERTESITSVFPTITQIGVTLSAASLAPNSTVDDFLLNETVFAGNEWNFNGGGNYGQAGNWNQGVPGIGANVTFGSVLKSANAPAVVNMNVAASLNTIMFATTNQYSIQGSSAITLTGDATVALYNGTHEIGARISGSSGLRKTAGGTLILSNDTNNFTGDINIAQGILEVTKLGALNQSSGSVNLTSSLSTLRFGGDGGGGASGSLTEAITGAGGIRLNNTLTTEVINFAAANPAFTGAVSIGGGALRVQNAGALGSFGTTAAVGTQVGGGAETGKLELSGVTVTGERLQLDGRPETNAAPALTATGNSTWTGLIVGGAGGNQYNIEAQAGSTLTLAGNLSNQDDTSTRFFNLSGPAGSSGRIEGQIIDRTAATGDGAENVNVSVVKKGAGTWTIATKTANRDHFHQRDTIVEQGTLAVEANANDGELWSRTIDVRNNAVFDASTFTAYSLQLVDPGTAAIGDEIGQELKGSGQVKTGGVLQAFDDSIITPGDSVGTLSIQGDFSYSTFTNVSTGRLNYQLGSTTAPASNDRVIVSGTATMNASDGDDVINLSVTPVQGTLSAGAYSLISANAVGGTATNANYVVKIRDSQGNDITSGVRQTFSVGNTATTVDLNVTGASENLSWAGTAGNAWDVKTSNNWTGTGGPQFNQLDNVTFGSVANKSVTVSTNVAPGSVAFNGGVGTTYSVAGSGGMTGTGPVNVQSGTVQLLNTGNKYTGTTTIATNARLEMATATVGSVVANGTLVIAGGTTGRLIDDFSDGDITEYTTYTVLDQIGALTTVGPPDDVRYSSTGTAITVNGAQNGNPAPEQALALRLESLGVGETLVVDTNFNTTVTPFSTVGISIANSALQADIPVGNSNADIRKGYLITGMRLNEATDGQNTQAVQAAGGTVSSTGPGNIGVVTNLWITRTGADSYTTGHSKDSMLTRVQADSRTGIDWTPDSVGFYADIRGALTPNAGTMDNLRILPGNNRLQVNGDLTLASAGAINLDIGQDSYDQIAVTGIASLGGTIDVDLAGVFNIANGAQYTLLTATGGILDMGYNLLLPANFTASIVNMNSLVLTYSAMLQGDYNGDDVVDAADYVIWRKTDGSPAGYNNWRSNFGATGGAGSGAGTDGGSVPEPTSWMLLVIALGFAEVSNRSRSRAKVSC